MVDIIYDSSSFLDFHGIDITGRCAVDAEVVTAQCSPSFGGWGARLLLWQLEHS